MDTVIEIEVNNSTPTIPSLTDSHGSQNRAELAFWLDWGEAPWVVFEKSETQLQGGTNASR